MHPHFMKAVLLFSSFVSNSVFSAEQSSERRPLDQNTSIIIPADWKFESFPMPIEGATNHRVSTDKLRMAITGFPVSEDIKRLIPLPATIKSHQYISGSLSVVTAQYFAQSSEKKFNHISFSGVGYAGGYVSFTSATGEPVFPVFPGKVYVCVTTAIIRTSTTIYSISIASDSCDGDEHKAAIVALTTLSTPLIYGFGG